MKRRFEFFKQRATKLGLYLYGPVALYMLAINEETRGTRKWRNSVKL